MVSTEYSDVWQELKEIRRRLEVLEDLMLSPDDKAALEEARKEFREGKTLSHEKVVRMVL